MDIVNLTVNQFLLFVLVLFRVAGIMIFAPFFGSRAIPRMVKVYLAMLLAAMLFAALRPSRIIQPDFGPLLIMAAGESAVGIVMGFAGTIVFGGFQLAGQMIGRQMGLAMANILDPITGLQVSLLAQLNFFFAMVIFLCINGHYWFIEGVAQTFELAPVGAVQLGYGFVPHLIDMGAEIFVIAAKMAAPVLAALLLAYLAVGLLSRTIPQMQVLMVGFPLFMAIGYLLTGFLLPYMAVLMRGVFVTMRGDLSVVMRYLLVG